MKNRLAKINFKKPSTICLLALVLAIPFFIYCKYLTTSTNMLTINVREPNYTVVFHSNDGMDATTSQSFTYGTSQALDLNSFTYTGYIFTSWNTSSDGTGTQYNDGQNVTNLSSQDGATINLYAQWDVDPSSLCSANKICYRGNGDDGGGTMSDQTVSSNSSVNLIPSNYSRTGYGFAGWNTKSDGTGTNYGPNQTITTGDLTSQGLTLYARWIQSSGYLQSWEDCRNMSVGTIIALTDTRDDNTYAVTKYGDNQCWMMENLRLDFSNPNLEISGLNTNAPSAAFVSEINTDHPASTNNFCTNNDQNCIDRILYNTNNTNRSLTASYDANNNSSSWYSYGNYYNWYTATAGHGSYNMSTVGAAVDGDICPAGWKLPTGYGGNGNFAQLDIAMGGNGQNQATGTAGGVSGSIRWRAYPYNFIYSGEQKGTSTSNRYIASDFVAANSNGTQRAINLWVRDDLAQMNSNSTPKVRGQTIRCIIREGYAETGNIHYEANGGSGTMADNTNVNLGTAVADNNTFTRPYYDFIGWNTSADGRGVAVSEGGSVAAAANHMGVTTGGTLTLYANWKPHYTLVYDGNGADAGSMTTATVDGLSGSSRILTAPNYSRTGYGFIGWSLDPNASTKFINGQTVTIYGPNETIQTGNSFYAYADSITNAITLYAVWLPEDTTKTMQTFGATECNAMNAGEIKVLRDIRDNNAYSVTKLADNHCWMIENLRLIPSAVSFDSNNTNSPTPAFAAAASSSSSSSTMCNTDDTSCVDQIVFNSDNLNLSLTPSYDTNTAGVSWYSYGVMYNWYTATAGNGIFSMASGNTNGDICPAGWRLATGGPSGEYDNLHTATQDHSFYHYDFGLVKFPVNFIYSGDYNNNKPSGRNVNGRYWSSTANNQKAYRLGFSTAEVTPVRAWNKWVGFSVRCIVK